MKALILQKHPLEMNIGKHSRVHVIEKDNQFHTPSVPISKHSFDFIFVPKCKSLFKLLYAFIIFFLNIPLINTTNLS